MNFFFFKKKSEPPPSATPVIGRSLAQGTASSDAEPLPHYRLISPGRLLIVNAPACYGQPKEGVELGPEALLDGGLLIESIRALAHSSTLTSASPRFPCTPLWTHISQHDIENDFRRRSVELLLTDVTDHPIGVVKRPRKTGLVTELLHDVIAAGSSQGQFVLTLGGDHSIALGTVAGVQQTHRNLVVFWVDAHSDIHTPSTTDSGNLHGCPVSFLLGLNRANHIEGFRWLDDKQLPIIEAKQLVYIGLRDIDRPERAFLASLGIACYSMREVVHYGIAKVMEMALAHVDPTSSAPIHCSFDIDALDPTVAPSTGTPVHGGLLEREGKYIVECLARTGRLVSMDLVEVNPRLGSEEDRKRTVRVGQSIIYSALGETYYD